MLPNLDERIEAIEAVLDQGVKQTVTDGVTTVYDLDFAERRAAKLRRRHPLNARGRRPLFSQPFDLSGGSVE